MSTQKKNQEEKTRKHMFFGFGVLGFRSLGSTRRSPCPPQGTQKEGKHVPSLSQQPPAHLHQPNGWPNSGPAEHGNWKEKEKKGEQIKEKKKGQTKSKNNKEEETHTGNVSPKKCPIPPSSSLSSMECSNISPKTAQTFVFFDIAVNPRIGQQSRGHRQWPT